jgi:hypothetical protein
MARGCAGARWTGKLAERRLAAPIGHRKGGIRHRLANFINHGVDLAPRRQIVAAPRRQAAQMRDGDAVDCFIEMLPG